MRILMVMVVVLGLAACQSNRNPRVDFQAFVKTEKLIKNNRVQRFRFQGWQPLNDRYLILRSSQRTSYLVKLMSSCTELPYANEIKLKQEFSTILNAKFDSIIVPGQLGQRCNIHSMYEMNKKQKAALLEFADTEEEMR